MTYLVRQRRRQDRRVRRHGARLDGPVHARLVNHTVGSLRRSALPEGNTEASGISRAQLLAWPRAAWRPARYRVHTFGHRAVGHRITQGRDPPRTPACGDSGQLAADLRAVALRHGPVADNTCHTGVPASARIVPHSATSAATAMMGGVVACEFVRCAVATEKSRTARRAVRPEVASATAAELARRSATGGRQVFGRRSARHHGYITQR